MDWATTAIVGGSLAFAAATCIAAWIVSSKRLNFRLGSTGWDFNKSWASNLAAVGALLGLILGSSKNLPQADLAPAALLLSVTFGSLVILGPITYLALQVEENGALVGTVGGFLLASLFVLWAAIGEVATAAAFFLDLVNKLPAGIVWLFVVVAVLAVLMLVRYAWVSMGWVLVQAKAPPVKGQPFAGRVLSNWHLM